VARSRALRTTVRKLKGRRVDRPPLPSCARPMNLPDLCSSLRPNVVPVPAPDPAQRIAPPALGAQLRLTGLDDGRTDVNDAPDARPVSRNRWTTFNLFDPGFDLQRAGIAGFGPELVFGATP
jgi:hypothetical protein